jgi:hypothetical protein
MKKIVYELVTTSGFTEQVSPTETTIDERRRIIEVLKDQLARSFRETANSLYS